MQREDKIFRDLLAPKIICACNHWALLRDTQAGAALVISNKKLFTLISAKILKKFSKNPNKFPKNQILHFPSCQPQLY